MASTGDYSVVSQHYYKDTKLQYVTMIVSGGFYGMVQECLQSYIHEIQDANQSYTAYIDGIRYLNVSETGIYSKGQQPDLNGVPREGDINGRKSSFIVTAVIQCVDRS